MKNPPRAPSFHGRNGFARKYVHPVDSELAGDLFLGCRAEAVKPRGDMHLLKADRQQIINELCLRQSARDSPGPQINVTAGILREFDIQGNISQVKAAAGSQHPHDFAKPSFLLRDEVQDTVRTDQINAGIFYRKSRRVALPDLDMVQPCLRGRFTRVFDHGLGHIDADGVSLGARPLRREQQIHPGTATDVEHRFTRMNGTDRQRVADSGERCRAIGWK